MPRQNVTPALSPVYIDIPDGSGQQLMTSINHTSGKHEVSCDLCGKIIVLTVSANPRSYLEHRSSAPCIRKANRLREQEETSHASAALSALKLSSRQPSIVDDSSSPSLSSVAGMSGTSVAHLGNPPISLSSIPQATSSLTVPHTPLRSQAQMSLSNMQTPSIRPTPQILGAPIRQRVIDAHLETSNNTGRIEHGSPTPSSMSHIPIIPPENILDNPHAPEIGADDAINDVVACPGVRVRWTAGSIPLTYPFFQHKDDSRLPYEPCGYIDSPSGEWLILRSKTCLSKVEKNLLFEPTPCKNCQCVPWSPEFQRSVQRAADPKPHTSWDLLGADRCRILMNKIVTQMKRMKLKIRNLERRNKTLLKKVGNYERIMILLSTNEVVGLRRLLAAALKQGASPAMLIDILERAIAGILRPRGGYSPRDLDIAFIVKAIGGPRLLYALNKSHGLASVTTVNRHNKVPQLLASTHTPSADDASTNISTFFNPDIKPAPVFSGRLGGLPGNIVMVDGIAIEAKCEYCHRRDCVLGLCREHVHNVDIRVTDLKSVESIRDKLDDKELSPDDKVCYGKDATVLAIAPYARSDHYTPIPIIVSPSCKSEKGDALAEWLQTVIETWKTHEFGERLHGPLWSLASDGESSFRVAKHRLCMKHELDPESELGKRLRPLIGLNCYTGDQDLTSTCDPKHIMKRFGTLLRNFKGTLVHDTMISPPSVLRHLCRVPDMNRERALQLLDPSDKQNVPKAVSLVQELNKIQTLSIPENPSDAKMHSTLHFFSLTLNYFVSPFITPTMSLSEQVRSLAVYAHLTAALYLKHGTSCLTGALYADSQAVVKNIMFTVARMQIIDPLLELFLILEGTDRLELLFGDCRTQNHATNFAIKQLCEKLGIATLLTAAFERNPTWDRGHRRLNLKDAFGIDHVNPKSWLGNVVVGLVNLGLEWEEARKIANQILRHFFGEEAVVDFVTLFSQEGFDFLRPAGEYVGVQPSSDDDRSDNDDTTVTSIDSLQFTQLAADVHGTAPETAKDTAQEQLPTTTDIDSRYIERRKEFDSDSDSEEDNLKQSEFNLPDNDFDDLPEGVAIDEFLPDSIADIENIQDLSENPAISGSGKFETFLMVEGRKYLKASVVASYLSSQRSRKATMRTLRARGVALEDLRKGDLILTSEELDDDNIIKTGDLVASLVRAGTSICLAVLEIKGFRVGTDRNPHTSIKLESLQSQDKGKSIKGIVQILDIQLPQNTDSWEWTGQYVNVHKVDAAKNERITHRILTFEIPAIYLHPISSSIGVPSNILNIPVNERASKEYNLTWKITNTALCDIVTEAWRWLNPDSYEIFETIGELPVISNTDVLPYRDAQGMKCLEVQDLPAHLDPKAKKLGKDKVSCFLCNAEIRLSAMRNHVGSHILCDMRGVEDEYSPLNISELAAEPCGFCGQADCITVLTRKGKKISISSSCPYHYTAMKYNVANQYSKSSPCTNVPIHCTFCPPNRAGQPHTIWKYNAIHHIIALHTEEGVLPELPPQFLIDIFISAAEEGDMGVDREATERFRETNNIPGSEDVAVLREQVREEAGGAAQKRERAPTTSVVPHPQKKPRERK